MKLLGIMEFFMLKALENRHVASLDNPCWMFVS